LGHCRGVWYLERGALFASRDQVTPGCRKESAFGVLWWHWREVMKCKARVQTLFPPKVARHAANKLTAVMSGALIVIAGRLNRPDSQVMAGEKVGGAVATATAWLSTGFRKFTEL
jgi:hypothetical protein